MFILSAPSWRLRKPRPRKKCSSRLVALDLQPNIRIHGIRHLTKHRGDKHRGINIKPLRLMLLGFRHLSISCLSSDLYQPITAEPSRTNPGKLEGLRRWKKVNTTVDHLSGCRAWWRGWCSPISSHPQEGKLGLRRTVTPWRETDAPSRIMCLCLGFGS
jgi:hypothetical protein